MNDVTMRRDPSQVLTAAGAQCNEVSREALVSSGAGVRAVECNELSREAA